MKEIKIDIDEDEDEEWGTRFWVVIIGVLGASVIFAFWCAHFFGVGRG